VLLVVLHLLEYLSVKDLLIQAETAIHDLLLEIYARDGHLNDRAWQIHNLLVKLQKEKR
jgi:hypothetical protein